MIYFYKMIKREAVCSGTVGMKDSPLIFKLQILFGNRAINKIMAIPGYF